MMFCPPVRYGWLILEENPSVPHGTDFTPSSIFLLYTLFLRDLVMCMF